MINPFQEIEQKENRSIEFVLPVKSKRIEFLTVVLSVLLSVSSMVGVLVCYDTYFAQKIVALDVKGYIAEQRDLYLTGKINDAQLKESFDRLEMVKERVPKNRVIILGDVLVRKNVEEIKP